METKSIGFFKLLTIAFVILKLTNQITWSWCWVLSPLSVPILIKPLISLIIIVAAQKKQF